MTASWIQLRKYFVSALAGLLTAGCTDGRIQRGAMTLTPQQSISTGGLVFANSFTFNGEALNAVQMKMNGGSLYLSGSPMGFMRAEISANPEQPTLTFAARDNIVNFSPIGAWGYDNYASGAIAITGNLALLSGSLGLSLVDLSTTNLPKEVARYPGLDPQSQMPIQTNSQYYSYKAIIANGSLFYGFRQQDYVYTASIANTGVTILGQTSYSSNGNVCCVTSATLFQGTIMVAFTNAIAMFQIGSNGQLTNPSVFNGLQATYITSTADRLYVQHTPTYGNATSAQYPRGIYVFNTAGQQVAFYPSNTFQNFAVAPDNRHLYGNRDGQSVEIYRIQGQ